MAKFAERRQTKTVQHQWCNKPISNIQVLHSIKDDEENEVGGQGRREEHEKAREGEVEQNRVQDAYQTQVDDHFRAKGSGFKQKHMIFSYEVENTEKHVFKKPLEIFR